jgi:hypothetical protein
MHIVIVVKVKKYNKRRGETVSRADKRDEQTRFRQQRGWITGFCS